MESYGAKRILENAKKGRGKNEKVYARSKTTGKLRWVLTEKAKRLRRKSRSKRRSKSPRKKRRGRMYRTTVSPPKNKRLFRILTMMDDGKEPEGDIPGYPYTIFITTETKEDLKDIGRKIKKDKGKDPGWKFGSIDDTLGSWHTTSGSHISYLRSIRRRKGVRKVSITDTRTDTERVLGIR